MTAPALPIAELDALLHAEFSQIYFPGCGLTIGCANYGDVRD